MYGEDERLELVCRDGAHCGAEEIYEELGEVHRHEGAEQAEDDRGHDREDARLVREAVRLVGRNHFILCEEHLHQLETSHKADDPNSWRDEELSSKRDEEAAEQDRQIKGITKDERASVQVRDHTH